jgi:glycerol-3-phosphate dehydrogenase
MEREEALQALVEQPLDVLVVGGGIVGAGVIYAAVRAGLRAGLVEQYDFAFGTSSRSSRLLHGGLRYLAQGRVGLVFEASQEKLRLSKVVPHLVEPLPFVFPSYRDSRWPLWQLRIGVKLYDALCYGRNFGPSRSLRLSEIGELIPGLRREGYWGAVRYFDALTNDSRLVLDTLRASVMRGGIVCNYLRFEKADREQNRWICQLVDTLTGERLSCETGWVVNACGPWAPQFPQSKVRLRLTKGIHLVISRERLPIREAVVMSEGKRILFGIPWGRRVILGTTDTDYADSLEDIPIEETDIDYVLGVTNEYFPQATIGREDVRAGWAGLRPLVAKGRGGPSDISRAHVIHVSSPGWVDVAGGKLTTYLLMGEQVVRKIVASMHRRVGRFNPGEPLLSTSECFPELGVLPPEPSQEVVEYFCRREWARRLEDIMIRRTSWHYYRDDVAQLSRQVASWMAEILGWDEFRKQEEIGRYFAQCAKTCVKL